MHARVTRMQAKPGRVDDIVRISRESVVPRVREQKGFMGVVQLVDRETDRAISITLWETLTDLDAVEQGGVYTWAISTVAQAFAEPYEREVWEVSIRE